MKKDYSTDLDVLVAKALALPEAKNHQIIARLRAEDRNSIDEISAYLKGCIAVGNFASADNASWRNEKNTRADLRQYLKNPSAAAGAGAAASSINLWDEVVAEINAAQNGALR
jgi:hypothetical protein